MSKCSSSVFLALALFTKLMILFGQAALHAEDYEENVSLKGIAIEKRIFDENGVEKTVTLKEGSGRDFYCDPPENGVQTCEYFVRVQNPAILLQRINGREFGFDFERYRNSPCRIKLGPEGNSIEFSCDEASETLRLLRMIIDLDSLLVVPELPRVDLNVELLSLTEEAYDILNTQLLGKFGRGFDSNEFESSGSFGQNSGTVNFLLGTAEGHFLSLTLGHLIAQNMASTRHSFDLSSISGKWSRNDFTQLHYRDAPNRTETESAGFSFRGTPYVVEENGRRRIMIRGLQFSYGVPVQNPAKDNDLPRSIVNVTYSFQDMFFIPDNGVAMLVRKNTQIDFSEINSSGPPIIGKLLPFIFGGKSKGQNQHLLLALIHAKAVLPSDYLSLQESEPCDKHNEYNIRDFLDSLRMEVVQDSLNLSASPKIVLFADRCFAQSEISDELVRVFVDNKNLEYGKRAGLNLEEFKRKRHVRGEDEDVIKIALGKPVRVGDLAGGLVLPPVKNGANEFILELCVSVDDDEVAAKMLKGEEILHRCLKGKYVLSNGRPYLLKTTGK